MAELIPTDDWKALHDIGHEALFRDVYHLLSFSLASKAIAELDNGLSLRSLSKCITVGEKSEISRLLIRIASYYRLKYDDGSWEHGHWLHKNFQGVGGLIEDISFPKSIPLTFREACNKIIHANRVHFDSSIHEKTGVSYLNPIIYLYGSKKTINWKATLDISQFCVAAGNIIV